MGRKAGGLGSLSLAPGQLFIGGEFFIPAGIQNSIRRFVLATANARVCAEGLREKAAQAEVGQQRSG